MDDHRQIERLIIDYAAHNDTGDWDALAALFTADGRMSRPSAPDAFVEGRAAILAAFQSRPARASRHIVGNIRIDIDGETARAESHLMLFTAANQAPMVGGYSDRLVKTADGWRFAERRGRLDFVS